MHFQISDNRNNRTSEKQPNCGTGKGLLGNETNESMSLGNIYIRSCQESE